MAANPKDPPGAGSILFMEEQNCDCPGLENRPTEE